MVTDYKKWQYDYDYYSKNIKISAQEFVESNKYKESIENLNRYAMHCYSYIENVREVQVPTEYKLSLAEGRVKSQYGLEFLAINNALGRDLNDIEISKIIKILDDIVVSTLNVISYLKKENMLGLINENTELKDPDYRALEREDRNILKDKVLDYELNIG